jgi:hypothetical protein
LTGLAITPQCFGLINPGQRLLETFNTPHEMSFAGAEAHDVSTNLPHLRDTFGRNSWVCTGAGASCERKDERNHRGKA